MKFLMALAGGLILLAGTAEAAERKTAGDLLWEEVGGCDFFSESFAGDKDLEAELRGCKAPPLFVPQRQAIPMRENGAGPYYIYEPDQGYLHVHSGPVPTCGCHYSVTVAAYGKSDGTFVLVRRDTEYCDPGTMVSAGVPLRDILPREITPEHFYQANTTPDYAHAYFYLDLDLPRQGTDTVLTLKPTFINRVPGSWTDLPFSPRHGDSYGYYYWDKMYLESKNDWDERYPNSWIPSRWDVDFWSQAVIFQDHSGKPALTPEQTDLVFTHLMNFYREYRKLKYQTFVLGWDRDKGKFYIKEKIEAPPKSFLDFLRELPFYSPSC